MKAHPLCAAGDGVLVFQVTGCNLLGVRPEGGCADGSGHVQLPPKLDFLQ